MRRAFALLLCSAASCSFEPVLGTKLKEGEADIAPDPGVELSPESRAPAAPAVPSSCRELREQDRSLPDGYYLIGADARRVWCDMTIDGGGWTLAGRSVRSLFGSDGDGDGSAASYEPFGWGIGTGEVDEDFWPYSLDVYEAGVLFTEVLVGEREDGKSWGSTVIAFLAGDDFLSRCAYERCEISPRAVIGDCDLESTHYAGVAEHVRLFVLDANAQGQPSTGLHARGFNVSSSGCSNIDGEQGMIFVR